MHKQTREQTSNHFHLACLQCSVVQESQEEHRRESSSMWGLLGPVKHSSINQEGKPGLRVLEGCSTSSRQWGVPGGNWSR